MIQNQKILEIVRKELSSYKFIRKFGDDNVTTEKKTYAYFVCPS